MPCTTGKASFASLKRAQRAARSIGDRGGLVHVYRCPACHSWHVGGSNRQEAPKRQAAAKRDARALRRYGETT